MSTNESESPSPSTVPFRTVQGLQSSSWSAAGAPSPRTPVQRSRFPGKRLGSLSSQSAPPHATAACPSPSASGVSQDEGRHSSSASSQAASPLHAGAPETHPSASAVGSEGAQTSAPLQNTPSSQSTSAAQVRAPSGAETGVDGPQPPPPSSTPRDNAVSADQRGALHAWCGHERVRTPCLNPSLLLKARLPLAVRAEVVWSSPTTRRRPPTQHRATSEPTGSPGFRTQVTRSRHWSRRHLVAAEGRRVL